MFKFPEEENSHKLQCTYCGKHYRVILCDFFFYGYNTLQEEVVVCCQNTECRKKDKRLREEIGKLTKQLIKKYVGRRFKSFDLQNI